MEVLPKDSYMDKLNSHDKYKKTIVLFPHDHLLPERHAVDPDAHYYALSKVALSEMGIPAPKYKTFEFAHTRPEDVELQDKYPYLVKTSHGLSGEGTYIIHNEADLNYCRKEVRAYLRLKLVDAVVVSDFVHEVIDNFCVQFYVGKNGDVKLLGATHQSLSLLLPIVRLLPTNTAILESSASMSSKMRTVNCT
jgi:hypothetical protein